MTAFSRLLLVFSCIGVALALYDGTDVQVFSTKADFDRQVVESHGVWMMHLYDNEDPALAKKCEMLASIVKGVLNVGAVDVSTDEGKSIAATFSAKSFPSLYVLGYEKKTKANLYDGKQDVQDMVNAMMKEVVFTFQDRSHDHGYKGGPSQREETQRAKETPRESQVVQLNEGNYQEQVLDNSNVVMVAFIAPWCGHCQKLLPEWEEAGHLLEDEDVTLGVVDATVEQGLAQRYGVQGYPTIKLFPGGKKTHSDAMDYNGERTASPIVKSALDEVDKSGVPKEIPELVTQTLLTETCAGPNRICVIASLPHILDSGVEGRNKYRDLLAVVAKRFRGASFRFLWMEGGSQYDFEQALELTFGYPALVALSLDRQAYAVMRGSFSEKAIGTFLAGITSGRQSTIKLSRELPALVAVEPWDGKEAKPLEDEIPLSEIMGWDDDEEQQGGEL